MQRTAASAAASATAAASSSRSAVLRLLEALRSIECQSQDAFLQRSAEVCGGG
jgi:hypothetical protein